MNDQRRGSLCTTHCVVIIACYGSRCRALVYLPGTNGIMQRCQHRAKGYIGRLSGSSCNCQRSSTSSIVRKQKGIRPIIALELPQSCSYWDREAMDAMLSKFNLRTVVTDGCAFELKKHDSGTFWITHQATVDMCRTFTSFLGCIPTEVLLPSIHVACTMRRTGN